MLFLPFSEGLAQRLSGPMSFRFILQPVAAIALGIRDGLTDARAGEPPYLIGVFFHPERRHELLASAWKQLLTPMVIGTILDFIFQYLVMHRVRLIPAIIVGVFLIAIPYALARGITNRIATRTRSRPVTPLPSR